MADKYDISAFSAQLRKTDIARTHLFRCILPSRVGEETHLYAESTNWPSKKVGKIDVPFLGFKQKIPGTVSFDSEWKVTFRCDMRNDIRMFFSQWQDEIFDIKTGASETFSRLDTAWFVALDNKLNPTKKIRFEGIWPTDIGDIEYKQDGGETYVTFACTFAYSSWSIES
jgi:hypothetical protein